MFKRIHKCCLVCDNPARITFNPSWATCTIRLFSVLFSVLPVHEHVHLCAEAPVSLRTNGGAFDLRFKLFYNWI